MCVWHLNNAQAVGIFDVNVTVEKEVKQKTIKEFEQPKSTALTYASDGKRAGGRPSSLYPLHSISLEPVRERMLTRARLGFLFCTRMRKGLNLSVMGFGGKKPRSQ